ncbi:Cilia- and flagella-associated protein 44 [Coelomomyces lativittatus]|nr:Cilia- and flagella-associated protein 44 [Coelomomyces lativittatus]KAJ1513717.1 Cilia- and flagella-associated protein 44 [Coelomomyces lativittatus]
MNLETFDIPQVNPTELHDSFFYPEEYLVRKCESEELKSEQFGLILCFGFPVQRSSSFAFFSSQIILFSTGNYVVLYNFAINKQTYIRGLRSFGLSAVAVHPEGAFFAVAEKHPLGPNIYIYSYPDIRLRRVLRRGAQNSYAHLSFSQDGQLLVSVANEPDYTLSVWDWKREHANLRTKAFSQDIYTSAFSPLSNQIIVSSGMGHIKFWKMASTFTGLKLQGSLGKFGATELTDIPCFVFLPSGKVISGTETGNLLLWDAGFIKYEITNKQGKPCHVGSIDCCLLDGGFLITAGEDGYIRSWDLTFLSGPDANLENENGNNAPKTTGSVYVASTPNLALDPMDSLIVVKNTKIKCLQKIPDSLSEYLLMDTKGKLWRVNLKKKTSDEIASFHSQSVVSVSFSFRNHRFATLGEVGSVRLYDPQKLHPISHTNHAVPGTLLKYLPSTLDVSGCSFFAAFQDGSIRFFRHAENEAQDYLHLARTHAFRPHDKPIVDVAFNLDGSMFATSTAEGQLFFFSVFEEIPKEAPLFDSKTLIIPIGVIVLPIKLKSITWLPPYNMEEDSGDRTIGALLLGSLNGTFNILTFAFNNQYETESNFVIPNTDYKYEPWSFRNYTPVSLKPIPLTPDTTHAKSEVENPSEIPITTVIESEEKSQLKETEKKVEFEPKYYLPIVVHSDILIICIECNAKQTEIRSCSLRRPGASKLIIVIPTIVTALTLSHSKKLLLIGCITGTVYTVQGDFLCNQDLHSSEFPNHPFYWCMPIVLGPVTSIASSFDDCIVAVSGSQGQVFTLKSSTNPWGKSEYSADTLSSAPLEDTADLVHPYTIQEAKRMTQLDLEREISSKKRAQSLENFELLRSQFEWIYSKVKQLPEELQLSEEELRIDPGLPESIDAQTTVKLQRVQNELLWDSEKIAIGLKKLKRRYFDSILSDAFSVKGFNNNLILYSMRTEKLNVQDSKSKSLQNSQTNPNNSQTISEKVRRGSKTKDFSLGLESQISGMIKPIQEKSLTRQEERRRIKIERQEAWKQLMSSKPSPHSEDPQDTAAIRLAETNMGDYKLKMDKNYVVPENEQLNAAKKKKQIILLQSSLNNILEEFNNQVRKLQAKREILVEKKAAIEQEKQRNEANTQIQTPDILDPTQKNDLKPSNVATNLLSSLGPQENTNASNLSVPIPNTKMETNNQLFEQEESLKKEIIDFDNELERLCQERLDVAIDFKSAEIRLLLLYKEWKLLREFEKHDQSISEKLSVKLAEKTEIDSKMEEIQHKIIEENEIIQREINKRKSIEAQIEQLLGDGNKYEDILKKIYRKKVKRKKRRENSEKHTSDNPDEEEEEDSYESDESDESDDSDESGEQVSDACPSGCDPEIHQQVLQIREIRLDIEDCLIDVQKALDIYKKEFDLHSKKEKLITSALKATEQEIQEFQNLKQRKLNELDTTVPLTLCQVHYFDDNFSDSLIFPQDGLEKLQAKITETEEETQGVRKNHQQLKLEHVNLLSNRKEKKSKLKELSEKCVEVQMLKFGRCVDIEKLEKMGTNKAADELRQQLLERDKQSQIELERMKVRLSFFNYYYSLM